MLNADSGAARASDGVVDRTVSRARASPEKEAGGGGWG